MKILSPFTFIWYEAIKKNVANILSLLEKDPRAVVLEAGCGDGKEAVDYVHTTGCQTLIGLDGQKGRVSAARRRGIDARVAQLEEPWPIKSSTVDVVITNQVIEHMHDIDHFISEMYRVLKKGAYCIVSTENLASWHNIAALFLGYQDFSHHIIRKKHVGNPFSPHFGEKTVTWSAKDHSGVDDSLYPHVKIMTYRSLRQVFEAYNFTFEKGLGSGYYPFFSWLGTMLSRLDPYHTHFITVKMRK